jgi:hypothetical protein
VTDRFPGLPRLSYVSRVVASRHAAGRVYATFDNHRSDDYRPYVYVSNDYGQTWRAVTRGLPETSVYAIQEHPRISNLIFLGHERGVHVSIDGGESWVSLDTNLPTVPVAALFVHPRDNDLIAATFGRAFWILDDLGPLEALASQRGPAPLGVVQAGAPTGDRVLPSRPGRLFNFHHYDGWFWAGYFSAPNPEYGAGISYWLAQPAKDVRIRVLDASGAVVRTLAGSTQQGINRIYWDLRMEPTQKPDPSEPYNPVFRPPPTGPPVLPGTYTAMIGVNSRPELKSTLTVRGDPMITISDADRTARQASIQELYRIEKSGASAQDALRPLTDQLAALKTQLSGTNRQGGPVAPEEIRTRVAAVADSLSALERSLGRDVGSINRLLDAISGYTGPPTPGQTKEVGWAREDLTTSIARLNQLLQKSIPDLYATLQTRNLWPSTVRAVPLPPAER